MSEEYGNAQDHFGSYSTWHANKEECVTARELNEREQLEHRERIRQQALSNAGGDRGNAKREQDILERVQFKKDIGKFILSNDNTLANQLNMVENPENGIGFSPEAYPLFDKIMYNCFMTEKGHAVTRNTEPVVNKNHPKYPAYEPLRNNAAAVRNFVFDSMFPDGSFDKNDEAKAPYLAQISREIAVALQRDQRMDPLDILFHPFADTLSIEGANIRGDGAALIYRKLLEIQNRRSLFNPKSWFTGKNKNWGLPPLEASPFAPQNWNERVDTPPPGAPLPPLPIPVQSRFTEGELMAQMAAHMDNVTAELRDVESLDQPVLDESVEIAREILEKLKLRFASTEQVGQWLKENPADALDRLDALGQIGVTYEHMLSNAAQLNPAIRGNPLVLEANNALGTIDYLTKRQAIDQLKKEGKIELVQKLEEEIKQMPKEWTQIDHLSVNALVDTLSKGFEAADIGSRPIRDAARQQQAAQQQAQQQQAMQYQQQQATRSTQKKANQNRMQTHHKAANTVGAQSKDPRKYDALQQAIAKSDVLRKDIEAIRGMNPTKMSPGDKGGFRPAAAPELTAEQQLANRQRV